MTALGRIVAALRDAGQLVAHPDELPAISGVTEDSRRVTPGVLFCAVAGTADDGHRYVPDAASRGAAAALVTRRLDVAIPQIVIHDSRLGATLAAREWYGRPAGGLRLVAVTGTNGKSTAVALIRHLLNAQGTVGATGTLGAFDGAGQPLPDYGSLTTPGTVELQAVLAELRRRGVDTVVLEASSHALDQRRLESLDLAAAVYTNLTPDHLDYHADLASYRAAKLRLSGLIAAGGAEVVNADDPAWLALPERDAIRRVRYGQRCPADVSSVESQVGERGSRLRLRFGDCVVSTELPLLGEFNVSNALAAAAAAWTLGAEPADLGRRLRTAPQVPGRMERLVEREFLVLRDYAHTPDALERAIAALRPLTPGRLIALFGAGGDRDRAKRPMMGRAAARGADLAIVTSDNPRTEDPDRIIRDIEAGMLGTGYLRIPDRREAILHAVTLLRPGDSLLLAGKGHETYQVIGTERRPFDERAIVEAGLAARAST